MEKIVFKKNILDDQKYKVSIIVAIYNSANFLDRLIKSALNQTYSNIEIILVDDGSPDNSGKICDKYAKEDSRILVIHKANGGAVSARNEGMKIASGDYMSVIDGDDWLESDYVEYLLNIVVNTDSVFAISDKIFTTRNRMQTKNDKLEVWTPEEATVHIIYAHVPIGPWTKLYKTSFLREHGIVFHEPWYGEGLHFTSELAQLAPRIGVGHRKVYDYRLNNTSSGTTIYKMELARNAIYNINNIKNTLLIHTKRLDNAIKWHIWTNNFVMLRTIIALHKEKECKEEYKSCVKHIKTHCFNVFIRSECGLYGKMKVLLGRLFPILMCKIITKYKAKTLAKDLAE